MAVRPRNFHCIRGNPHLHKTKFPLLLRIQPDSDSVCTIAVLPCGSLQIIRTSFGKNAVQRRNEVVRIDSHIQESAENIDHVVCGRL